MSANLPPSSAALLQKQALAAVIGVAGFAVFCWVFGAVLGPFILGAVMAYFLDPAVDALQRRGLGRGLATSLVLAVFVLVLAAALALIVPTLQSQLAALMTSLPVYIERARALAEPMLAAAQAHLDRLPLDNLHQELMAQVKDKAPAVARAAVQSGLAVVDIISFVLIAPVVAFHLLKQWDTIIARIDSWVPRRHVDSVRTIARDVDAALSGFVRGQAVICFALGAYYAVALSAKGLEFGLVIGLAAGLLSFIPYIGTLGGFVTAMLVAYVQYNGAATELGIVAGIFALGQFVEGNILTPRIVGGRVGLHDLWIIFALMAGSSFMGFTGLLLAVPVAAVIGVLIRFFLRQYLSSGYYGGQDA